MGLCFLKQQGWGGVRVLRRGSGGFGGKWGEEREWVKRGSGVRRGCGGEEGE